MNREQRLVACLQAGIPIIARKEDYAAVSPLRFPSLSINLPNGQIWKVGWMAQQNDDNLFVVTC
jgi:hypothetical protein